MPQLDPSTFAPQLFWLLVTFVLLYLAMWKIALPKIGSILQDRQERIDDDLEKAEKLKQDAEAVREAYEKTVAEGRNKAQETIRSPIAARPAPISLAAAASIVMFLSSFVLIPHCA